MAIIDLSQDLPDLNNYTQVGDELLSPEELQSRINSGQVKQIDYDPNQGNFSRGLTQAGNAFKQQGGGLLSLAGDLIGNDTLRDTGLNYAKQQQAISQIYARDTDRLEGINNLSDFGAYVANQAGQQLPGLIGSLATGGLVSGAVGLTGRVVAKRALQNSINNQIENQLIKSPLLSQAGFKAGLAGFGAGQSAGDIYPRAVENNEENPALSALAGGALGGAINVVGDSALLNNFLKPSIGSSVLNSIATNVGKSAGINAASNLAESVSSRGFSGDELTGDEAYSEYLNSAVSGGVAGAPFGVSGIWAKKSKDSNAVKNAVDSTIMQKQNESAQEIPSKNKINSENKVPYETSINNDINSVTNDNIIPSIDESLQQTDTNLSGNQIIPKRDVSPDLNTSDIINTIKVNNEDLAIKLSNIKQFDETALKDAGLDNNQISSIKNEYKTKEINNRVIDGYRVEDLLTKDISSLPKEKIDSYRNELKKISNEYNDVRLENKKVSNELVKKLDENYKNESVEDSIIRSEILDENIIKNEAITQSDPFEMKKDNTIEKVTSDDNTKRLIDDKNANFKEVESPNDNSKSWTKDNLKYVERYDNDGNIYSKDWYNNASGKDQLIKKSSPDGMVEYFNNGSPSDGNVVFSKGGNTPDVNNLGKIKEVQTDVANRLKNTNVNFNVVSLKDLPFNDDSINGFYNKDNHTITIVAENYTPESIQVSLNHELTHAGIRLMTKDLDRVAFDRQLEELARNPELNQLANKIAERNNLDRITSIEEGLSVMGENGDWRKLNGIEKFYNFVKSLVNKMLGREQITSIEQIKDYITRAHEYTLDKSIIDSINKEVNNTTTDYMTGIGNINPNIVFSKKNYTEKEQIVANNKDTFDSVEKIKEAYKLNKANDNLIRNSTDFVKNSDQKFDNLKKDIATMGKLGAFNKENNYLLKRARDGFLNTFATVGFKAKQYESTRNLSDLYNASRIEEGKLKTYNVDEFLDINNLNVSPFDDTAVNLIISDAAHLENNGNGKKLSIEEVKERLINYRDKDKNKIKDINKSLKLYIARRRALDNAIHKEHFLANSDIINQIERIAVDGGSDMQFVNKLKQARYDILNNPPKYEKTANNDSFENLTFQNFYKETSISPAQNNGNLLNIDLSKPENVDINNRLSEHLAMIKDNNDNALREVNINGYAPKDHSGKFTSDMQVTVKDLDGNDKVITFNVHAFDSQFKRDAMILETNKMLDDAFEKGLIKDRGLFKVISKNRTTETLSDTNANKIVQNAQRNGVEFDRKILDQLFALSNDAKRMERKFKEGGGQNIDFDAILSRNSQILNKDIANSINFNNEIEIIRSAKEGFEMDLLNEMQNGRYMQNNDYDKISSKIRSFASMWILGWNMSSAGLQTAQYFQAAPTWMGQFADNQGISVTSRAIGKAFKYLKNGTTGDKALDLAIKDFTSPLLGPEMSNMLFNTQNQTQYARDRAQNDNIFLKLLKRPFLAFAKAEELNRLTTFLASHDVFYNRDKYKSRREIGDNFQKFAIENIIRVNGDYSAEGRPKILRGSAAETLLMFQQFKGIVTEMFASMDTKAKYQFIATMMVTAGINGVPGTQDADEILQYLSKLFGFNYIGNKKKVNEAFDELGNSFGIEGFSEVINDGAFPSLGSRAGLGDFVPFLKPAIEIASGGDVGQALQQQGGPVTASLVNMQRGLGSLFEGDFSSAFRQAPPVAARNIIRGIQQGLYGNDLNSSNTAINYNTDMIDGMFKVLGFSTMDELSERRMQNMIQDTKAIQKYASKSYKNDYLKAALDKDSDGMRDAINRAKDFNSNVSNREAGIAFKLDLSSWRREARNSQLTQKERTLSNSNRIIKDAFS